MSREPGNGLDHESAGSIVEPAELPTWGPPFGHSFVTRWQLVLEVSQTELDPNFQLPLFNVEAKVTLRGHKCHALLSEFRGYPYTLAVSFW